MKALRIAAACLLTAAAFAPDACADGRKPGSVLVFPWLRHGISIISVSNTHFEAAIPGQSFGGSTNVHFEYVHVVEGTNPFKPASCRRTNIVEFLTPADTMSVLSLCHSSNGPAEKGGYLVVSAQDPSFFGRAWSHNYLVGVAIVADAIGAVQVVNAVPFESPVDNGAATDLNMNQRLDFNGVEYEAVPDQLYADNVIPCGPPSRLSLLNLTGGPTECNTIMLSIWNDNEVPLSATQTFSCWFDQPLEVVAPVFQFHSLNRLPSDPEEMDWDCDGREDINTAWFCIDSLDVSTSGGIPYARDGAMLGTISPFFGTHLLWESVAKQSNGAFFTP